MKKNYLFFVLFVLCILLVACTKQDENIMETKYDSETNKTIEQRDLLAEQIKNMNLEEKIGQLMILGFNGDRYSDEIEEKIDKLKPSGFILFSKNIKNYDSTIKLLNSIKIRNKENKIPLFLSLDEEGGIVSRVPKEFNKLPRAKDLGKIEDDKVIYELGEHLGKMVKSMGFNMNFAPVLDINSNKDNPVIGSRSYSEDKNKVYKTGSQILAGMNKSGVIGSVKHFPGHGDTSIDSHSSLPIVKKSIEELDSEELYPFKKIIEDEVDSIMIAHVLYPELDGKYPASLSLNIKEDMLRKEYGYNGVIISDDMTMGAITQNYSTIDAATRFIKTGGDLVLLCHGENLDYEFQESILKEMKSGDLSENDIDEKVYRILKLKNKYKVRDEKTNAIDIQQLNNELEEILKKEEIKWE